MLEYISWEAAMCFLPVTLLFVFDYLFMYVFKALVIFNLTKSYIYNKEGSLTLIKLLFYLNLVKTVCGQVQPNLNKSSVV